LEQLSVRKFFYKWCFNN